MPLSLRLTYGNYNKEGSKEADGKINNDRNHDPFHQVYVLIVY